MGETMNGGISRGGRLEGGFGEGGHAGSGNAHETGRVHPVKPKSEDQQVKPSLPYNIQHGFAWLKPCRVVFRSIFNCTFA